MRVNTFWMMMMMMILVIRQWNPIQCQYHSERFGLFAGCRKDSNDCWWHGSQKKLIQGYQLALEMIQKESLTKYQPIYLSNILNHIEYVENLHGYAKSIGYSLGFQSRVTPRLLYNDAIGVKDYKNHVHAYLESQNKTIPLHSRKLSVLPSYLNWCENGKEKNPKGMNVCTSVKSQKRCGSCWAFAGVDAIEAAFSIASNQPPIELSPQQLLDCSRNGMTTTFQYCWLEDKIPGVEWLFSEIQWKSQNNGCFGGMTHAAFQYGIYSNHGFISSLDYPYDEGQTMETRLKPKEICRASNFTPAVRITGWSQVVGTSCSTSKDPSFLLKQALQKQPIAVAVNSEGPFNTYSGGMYTCPHNGSLVTASQVNHALVLVGYGTSPQDGNYWILKNSFGSNWGHNGFMYLKEDSKVNCGLNIYPVVPNGASVGSTIPLPSETEKDTFLGISYRSWLVLSVAFVQLMIIFIVILSRSRANRSAHGKVIFERTF